MKKTVSIAAKPAAAAPPRPSPDSWVSGTAPENAENAATALGTENPPAPPSDVRMKRLTIDIPEDLHTRLKVACARKGTRMADEVRALLETYVANATN